MPNKVLFTIKIPLLIYTNIYIFTYFTYIYVYALASVSTSRRVSNRKCLRLSTFVTLTNLTKQDGTAGICPAYLKLT